MISKEHWDKSHGLDEAENANYYTVPQAVEKFGVGRSHLYDLIRAYRLPKIKRGKNVLIHKFELDDLFSNRKR